MTEQHILGDSKQRMTVITDTERITVPFRPTALWELLSGERGDSFCDYIMLCEGPARVTGNQRRGEGQEASHSLFPPTDSHYGVAL